MKTITSRALFSKKNMAATGAALALTGLLALHGCKPEGKLSRSLGFSKEVDFKIMVGRAPLEGGQITVIDNGARPERTDHNGEARIYLQKKLVDHEGAVRIVSEDLGLDTTMRLRLVQPMDIFLKPQPFTADREQLRKKARAGHDDLGAMIGQAGQIEALLKDFGDRVAAYVRAHPNTALSDFGPVVEALRARTAAIRVELLGLHETYAGLLEEMDMDEIGDMAAHEANRRQIRAGLGKLSQDANDTEFLWEGTVAPEVSPDEELSFAVLFPFKMYKLTDLNADQRGILDGYSGKIGRLLQHPVLANHEGWLRLRVVVIGYTDGAWVERGSWLEDEILPLCAGKIDRAADHDGNNCLSFARATSVAEWIAGQYPKLRPIIDANGKGSSLANGSTAKDDALRKCEISFSLMPGDWAPAVR